MTLDEFLKVTELNGWGAWDRSSDQLPCFINRYTVTDEVNSPELIKEYIKHASADCDNDVLVFSVTERDGCWKVWNKFAKDFPRTFKVVEGGSIHGRYKCRMFIYTKPPAKRKFHVNNIHNFRAR